MAKRKGISDTKLALYNRLQRERFRAVPPGERVLFLPHCLRKAKGCRSENTEEGLICKHCSPDCPINNLTNYAASRGYRCFVVPGGEMLFNLVEKYRPKGIVGVACHHEIGQAADRITGKESSVAFAYQGVPLSKSGCVDTKVDESAVKEVLDLGPPPGRVTVSPVLSPGLRPQRVWARRAAGFSAAAVVLAALMVLVPGLLQSPAGPVSEAAPELLYSSAPSVRFEKDPDMGAVAEVRVPVRNDGPGTAYAVMVRATAYYCGQPYARLDGGIDQLILNHSLEPGAREEVLLHVRAHSANDTSVLVETLLGGKVKVSRYIPSAKPVFLTEVKVAGYTTSLLDGREANLSVQVFNEQFPRTIGSLRLVAKSYSSMNTFKDSEEATLAAPLGAGESWSVSILVKVYELDPGPSFVVELYENGGSSPADTAMVPG